MLLHFLKHPKAASLQQYTTADWQTLVNEARHHNLLGRVYYFLEKNDLLSLVPKQIIWHFEATFKISARQKVNTFFEIEEINNVLTTHNIKPIYLKGSAYCIRNAHCSNGRVFSDIDVLVSKEELKATETSFFAAGWLKTQIDDYDEKYYRIWMHEIPPLQHFKRNTVIDLHHNIMPLTNRYVPDMSKFETQEIKHPWFGSALTLSKTDMFIHSAVHLFTESEFDNGLRDLSDLTMLIDEFSINNKHFTKEILERANTLGLLHLVALALRYITQLFDNQNINTAVLDKQLVTFNYNPGKIKLTILDYCFVNVFTPSQPSMMHSDLSPHKKIASFILYCRSHLMKMPLRILLPHLCKKALMSIKEIREERTKKKENITR